MPSIVLIGTEGSGKTVLTTVMAKNFHHRTDLGCLLDPQTRQTCEFVDQNWNRLRHGEWPNQAIGEGHQHSTSAKQSSPA